MTKKILAVLILLLTLTGCVEVDTPPNLVAIQYGAGWTEGRVHKTCHVPGTHDYLSGKNLGDTMVYYPARPISFTAETDPNTVTAEAPLGKPISGAERVSYTVVSSDNQEIFVPVTVTAELTKNCDLLAKLHDDWGSKYNASFNADGTWGPGYLDFLNFALGGPSDVILDRNSKDSTVREIWNDEEVRIGYETEIQEELPGQVADLLGEEYFTNFNVVVKKPDPPAELKAIFLDEQTNVEEERALTAQAKAQEDTAEALENVAKAEARTKAAEIAPYGSVEAYNQAQAVQNGINPWQPTIVYGAPPAAPAPEPESTEAP